MMLLFRTFCVFVCVFSLCYGQRGVKEGRRRHQQHREREQRERERQLLLENIREDEGLFPSVLNLASRALISSNATCGEAGPERYCKLVEHGAQREPQCGVCDARARDTARRHPPELAIDGSNRWWQSPSLHQGSHFQWVTLTLDLRQVFEVAYVIVKSGISPRPGNWILERSLDGINFSAWQYYALSDPECESWFGVVATKGRPTYRDDTEVICTSYFSKLDPLEGGEIHTSLVNGRPGANGTSSALREFTRARYIRLRLQRIRTLYADLMSLAGDDLPGRAPEPGRGDQPIGNPGGKADASVTQRYFYSIKDISIGGQCVCHGHASDCPLDKESGVQACRCRHNTCGSSCERCCPLYNQQVWRAGSVGDAAKCEPCQCHGHASSCVFDPEVARNRLSLDTKGERRGGGVCQDCRDHTTGVNCEICSDGYFRPPGVSRDNPHPCRPCQCHPAGCPSGRCASVADDGEEQVQLPGQCECRPGFTGRHCDKCAPGYRGFPNCVTCPCNLAGTQLDQQADCEEDCRCKENVEGVKCDRCKPGFFALDAERPEGCVACFCSGVAGATCKEARLSIQSGELDTESGWSVTDLTRTTFVAAIRTASGALEFAADDLPFLAEDYFWSAPPLPYLSGLLTSYGQKLTVRVSWVSVRGDTSGRPTMCADLVLVGDGFTIGTASTQHTGNNATIAVTLREEGWQHMLAPDQGTPVTRTEFLRVLAGLQHVMIRAKFHTDQIEGRLNLASLERGLEGEGEGVAARHIEECSCPLGYSGLSCERCQNGFRRVNNTLQGGLCLPCDCHGHAPTCDPFTGSCGECEDNAEGEMCELCKPGYYGDARLGRPDSCRRCSCPLEEPASNNVSPTCEADLNDPREYTCNACARGYEGRHCERCAPGFWGNPLQPGSECKPCECQGGTALQPGAQQGPSCDPLTGRCLRCRGNTVGWRCESCLPGHYGSPEMADCRPCKCDPEGSDGSSCDSRSGQCTCRPHVTGRTCDRCEEGRGGISAGCPTCQCHPEGSLNGDCDARSGQCPCRPGVGGKRCDHCLPNHYGLSRDGCHRCACDPSGSDGTQCDIVTGQCRCKPNVEGRACNKCRLGYWDISSRQGCVPCACDQVGCAGGHCDPDSGQCACRPGVTGRACERCKHGFYGFSTSGCKECEPCNKPGHICDPDTGRCVCPMLTEGPACERCRTGAYNHEVGVGCKACGCHSAGSQGAQCDGRTGVCPCRPGFSAPKCDSCMPGFYGFPRCRPCECHVPGTTRSSCPFGQPCGCDDTGQCQCKSNVVGKRCEHCKRGTFSLQADNPEGCTTCFCFNRATQCTQAQLVWSQVRMLSPRSVSIEYDSDTPQFHPGSPILPVNTQEICYINLAIPGGTDMNITQTDGTSVKLNVSNNLRIIPGDAGNVRIGVSYLFDTPLYWKLPRNFIGDKVVSYNGYLRFTTKATGGQTLLPPTVLESYPLVQLQGNNKIVLEYFAPQTSPTGQYQVRFHEAWWRAKNSLQSGAVTRETMMLALQNVQHILIRATDSVDFKTLELRDVSMDFAVQPRPTHDGTALSVPAWQLARGVEQCECLHEYRATSCQNPSIGFYRWLPPPHHTESTIIIQLLGESRPCACASRSATCDPETGACVNCTENTAGPACDRCAAGFFGDPKQAPCRPCPCPNPHNNRASSCVVGREIQCRCQPGYTGPRCERCAYGYFGYPLSVGGSCQPCECDVRGSVSDECHEETGQCNCRPGVEGRDCTVCPPRHVLGERGCVTCNDKCTGVLLQELQTLSLRLAELNMTGLSPAPWGRVYKIERHVQGPLRQELDAWLRFMATDLPVDAEEEMRRRTRQLQAKSKRLSEESHNVAQDADKTRQDAQGLLDETRDMQSDTEAVVANLRQYGRHDETTSFSISAALREAGLLLDKITSVNLSKPRKNADHALKKAREQLVGLQDMLSSGELEDASDAIQERLRDIVTRLMDLEKHARAANEALDQTSRMNKYNSAARDTTSELIPRIEDLAQTEKETALERNRLNKDGQELLQEARENFEELSRLVMEVSKVSQMVEHREGILARLNPLYKRQYVTPAAEHAAELMRQARLYNDRFNATREVASFALKAAQAYQGIVSAIEEGIKSSEEAKLSADKAYERAFPSGTAGADALVNRAREARKHSEALNLQAKDVGRRAEVLRTRLAQQRAGVQNLGDRLSIAGERHDGVLRDLDHLSSNVRTVTLAALEKSSASNEKIKETLGQVDQVSEKIENELRPVLKRLASENSPALALAASDIEKARKNMRDANTLLAGINRDAATQNARMAQWNDTLSEQLQQLRDSIAQARHAANGIRLSLGSAIGRNCIRSYKARIEPATTSNIVVTFAPSRAGDGVILLLRSDPTLSKDFLALELRDKRVKLSWDLGGGLGYVIHPLPVKPASNLANDSSWFRAEVDRTGHVARLYVRSVISPSSEWPEPARNASPAGFNRLDAGPGATLWLGGYGGLSSSRPEGIVPTSMPGCIHQVWFDGSPLGLWDFLTTSGPETCTACIEGVEEIRDEQAFSFLGDGYSVLNLESNAPYNPYQYSVSMAFRTFDEDALLFLAVNPKRDRFITVALRGGRVHYRVDYGGGSRLELTTSQRYNTGEQVRFEAARHFDRRKKLERGLLRVGAEEHSGAPSLPPGVSSLPDLAQGTYLVGGAPPGFMAPSNLPPPELRSFRGCVSDLQVINEGYNLLLGTFYAVEPGCPVDVVKVVSFAGDGYLELPGQTLGRKASLGLVFATTQPDALLLLSEPVYHEAGQAASFYSVSLLRGQLHVRVGAGKGNVTVRSGNTFNDGLPHSVSVIKTNRRLELLVDDKSVSATKLAEGSQPEVRAKKGSGLYLGGLPNKMVRSSSGLAASVDSLSGLIRDLVIADTLLSMAQPVSFSHAGIGRSKFPALSPVTVMSVSTNGVRSLPDRAGPTHCEPSRAYSVEHGAVKFGDKPHSHVVLQKLWPQRNGVPRNFTLHFDFRTHYPNGLLFLMPAFRPKQRHFVRLEVHNSHLEITLANPKKEIKMRTKAPLNDGEWHSVEFVKVGQNVQLKVDGKEVDRKKGPKKLNVLSTAYVGGLPETNSIAPLIGSVDMEDFKGCLRNVKVQGRIQDLVGQRSYSYNVGQCFPRVETGSFFPGDAYAIYQNMFEVGTMLELELEFRTAELNGVLLSVSEPLGYPALSLELLDGQVFLSGDMGNRKPFRVQQTFSSKFTACDNRWHHVQAFYINDSLMLRVDQQTTNYGHSLNGGLKASQTNSSLYIGGLPDSAPSGTLQTRDNFKGCIRNVAINRERRDWTDMVSLHNVLLSACPLSSN